MGNLNNYAVLFVDDEVDFLETLIKRMKKRKLNAKAVHSGEEAIGYMQREKVDVVVLDVKMPGMGGIATMKELKKEHPLVEVIILTGHASLGVAKEGMELGAFDYLMKPADMDDLLYKIEDAYKKKILQEEKIKTIEKVIEATGE